MTDLVEPLKAIVGKAAVITDAQEMEAYATDQRKRYFGKPLAVVKPASTQEVAAVVQLCAQTRTAVVPQGGNTSLCGGATPDGSGAQIVLSLSRLNRIRAVDAVNNTITAEAGCVLANLQQAAAAADRLFPLSLAAEGSCEIGGNLPPTPAAPRCCATAMRAIWCSAWKQYCPMAGSGMACAA